MDKVIDLLKEKDISIPRVLFNNYKKLKLNEVELILITFLINSKVYNPKLIADTMEIKLPILLEMIFKLEDSGIIKIEIRKENGVQTEFCNLNGLYEQLALIIMKNEEVTSKSSIYDIFEQELGRTLSPIEYELVSEWLNSNSEEILKLALKEATYNGVSNFRYIDRIIHEWNKKGIKTREDVIRNNEEFKRKKKEEKQELFDYDWLNDK